MHYNPSLQLDQKKAAANVIHLPGLNGIRAIAAIAVVFSHIKLMALPMIGLGAVTGEEPLEGLQLAAFGVTMFFTLSGFLITYLLLQEKAVKPVNVGHFYMRRILRIWPIYYLYIALCVIVMLYYNISYNHTSLYWIIFLAANVPYITQTGIPLLSHYWSLGVEEQFYAWWPWLAGRSKQLFKITIAIIVLLLMLKVVFKFVEIKYHHPIPYRILHTTRFHCMLIGAAAAMLHYENRTWFRKITTNRIAQVICWGILLLIAMNKYHGIPVFAHEVISVVTVIIIMSQIVTAKRLVNLDRPLFNFLGKISYGIYVYHVLVLFLTAKLLQQFPMSDVWKYIFIYVGTLVLTITVAYISYNFIEKKFLRMKSIFSVIKSRS